PAPASEPSHGSPVASAKPPVPTAPTPAPAKPVVHITAPANAQLSVAGTVVGTGEFHTDTLKPGRYEILATLPDSGDQPCPTLRVTTTITAPATRSRVDTRRQAARSPYRSARIPWPSARATARPIAIPCMSRKKRPARPRGTCACAWSAEPS